MLAPYQSIALEKRCLTAKTAKMCDFADNHRGCDEIRAFHMLH
jgi:hypothetical protein